MASFNEDGLKKKLDDLNMSQQSIQTVSLWLIHHKKHAHTVVNVWYRELISGQLVCGWVISRYLGMNQSLLCIILHTLHLISPPKKNVAVVDGCFSFGLRSTLWSVRAMGWMGCWVSLGCEVSDGEGCWGDVKEEDKVSTRRVCIYFFVSGSVFLFNWLVSLAQGNINKKGSKGSHCWCTTTQYIITNGRMALHVKLVNAAWWN